MVRTGKPKIKRKRKYKTPGRLGVWQDDIPERAYKLCSTLGARNKDLATAFGVNITSIEGWLRDKPEFTKAVHEGKDQFDTKQVEKTLLMRAQGYEYDEEQNVCGISALGNDYNYTRKTKKKVLPDVTAMIFWLKNRDRERWADINEHHMHHSGTINHRKIEQIPLDEFTQEEKDALFLLTKKQLTSGINRN